jgi:hypothetical protein
MILRLSRFISGLLEVCKMPKGKTAYNLIFNI